MLSTTFLPLCVGRIYVATAARGQSERTAAPVGGNITFANEPPERSLESDEPRIGMPGLRRDLIWQIAERERGNAKLMCSKYQEDALIAGNCETNAT
jgi:hypothetical protein